MSFLDQLTSNKVPVFSSFIVYIHATNQHYQYTPTDDFFFSVKNPPW